MTRTAMRLGGCFALYFLLSASQVAAQQYCSEICTYQTDCGTRCDDGPGREGISCEEYWGMGCCPTFYGPYDLGEIGRHISWTGWYNLYYSERVAYRNTCGDERIECEDRWDGTCAGGYDYCCQNYGCWGQQC
jgi:hypothetical protein